MSTTFYLILFGGIAIASEINNIIKISNAGGLIELSKNVNNGKKYSGTTILLNNDIDFTEEESKNFAPIGTSSTNYFNGIFDGQGHKLSNLKIKGSSSEFVELFGVFGYSYGVATIKNVVVDPSCSFSSSSISSTSQIHVGGFLGYVVPKTGTLIVENIVNMGKVLFDGTCSNLYLGGIIGAIPSIPADTVIIRNCANYGPITNTGEVILMCMGGIIGLSLGSSSKIVSNCLNYGIVEYVKDPSNEDAYIGGIAGQANSTVFENCMSSGKIVPTSSVSIYSGGILGIDSSNVKIEHCYWTADVNCLNACGSGSPSVDDETELIEPSADYTDYLNEVNNSDKSFNKWIFNTNNKSVTFYINNGNGFTLSSQLILLPDLIEGSGTFSGWYTDIQTSSTFDSTEITTDTNLYGGWQYTVTLNATEGALPQGVEATKSVVYGQQHGELPEAVRSGHTFKGWYTESNEKGEKVKADTKVTSASDYTLYAQWDINNYTLVFDLRNGTVINEILIFSDVINYPSISERGYTLSWDKNIDFMPAENTTITLQWISNDYTATFDFDNGTTLNETFSFNSLIVYPDVSEIEGYTFTWDNTLEFMPADNITIIGNWSINSYLLKFIFENGTVIGEEEVEFKGLINYPIISEKEGHTFTWDNDALNTMPAKNVTVTGKWTVNKYILSFDFGNGTVVEEEVEFGSEIVYPANVVREGYVLSEWAPSGKVMTANNLTITAQWAEATQFVEITFSTVDMTEAEIIEVLSKYTDSSFSIDLFEVDSETGSTTMIIRFEDPVKSNEFVRNVNTAIREGTNPYLKNASALIKVPPRISYSGKEKLPCSFSILLSLY